MKNMNVRCDTREIVAAEVVADVATKLVRADESKALDRLSAGANVLENARKEFLATMGAFNDATHDVAARSKIATGTVRDCQQKMGDALDRMTKTADFPRLERYVLVLERAASAMQILADLESTGQLDKIAKALK